MLADQKGLRGILHGSHAGAGPVPMYRTDYRALLIERLRGWAPYFRLECGPVAGGGSLTHGLMFDPGSGSDAYHEIFKWF